MTGLQLTFLTEFDQSDRSRIRYSLLLPFLQRFSTKVELLQFPKSYRARCAVLSGTTDRVLVLPARLYSEAALALIRRRCKGLILDLDDAIYERPWDRSGTGNSRTRIGRFRGALEAQDAVVCAGPYLQDLLLSKEPSLYTRLIPNPIAPETPSSLEKGQPLNLLWIGSRSTLGYLQTLIPSLELFARERPETVLRVVADAFPRSETLKIECVPWSLEAQNKALSSSHIGLMPLDNHPWSLGKSGFKVLQYMSAGLPVVSSRFGNGAFLLGEDYPYFADNAEEWIGSLECLSDSETERENWGQFLRGESVRRFHPECIAKAWMGLVTDLDERLSVSGKRAK